MPGFGVSGGGGTDVAGLAQESTSQAILAQVTSIAAEDFATETTLAAMSAKLPATLGQTTKAGSLSVTVASDQGPLTIVSGLVPEEYDEIVLTYVGIGIDGEGEIATATYKLATATVATLTMSYNTDNKLVNVVRT